MIHIVKTTPPKELSDYNQSYDQQKSYDNFRDKNSIRKALLEEQGYICAYCMCAIGYDPTSLEKDVRIEHYRCQDEFNKLQLDYNNMFAVCTCSKGLPEKEQHCDVSKGNKYLHFDPKNHEHIKTIRYSEGGILSTDQQYADDIENVLGLNNSYLPINRRGVLTTQIQLANAKIREGYDKNKVFHKLFDLFSQKDKYGRYRPYCGIVTAYCNKFSKEVPRVNT
ncbi:MAG: hypothetical protein RR313_07495 [Anaerovoracaceae bacterium]